jgi:DNA-directed RNA polymerase specialized sigma24 family protein
MREENKKEKLKKEIDNNKNLIITKTRDSFDLVTYFISKIPEKYANVLGGQLNGKTEKDIAVELGISQGTVKSRASRGKEFIRKLIKRGDIENGDE